MAEFPERNPNPVINLDATGRILYANPASRELAHSLEVPGVSASELLDTGTRNALLADPRGRHEVQRAGRTLLFEWYWLETWLDATSTFGTSPNSGAPRPGFGAWPTRTR